MDKKSLRKQKMFERESLSEEKLQALSDVITEKVIELDEYKNAESILCFVSCKSEVKTDKLIRQAIKSGKIVGVPKVEGKDINFYRINSLNELEPGYFGILEPRVFQPERESDAERSKPIDPSGSLVIVPGLVFDRDLNRIGYGKGFYDRYFSSNKDKCFVKCGIAFEIQLCEHIDADVHDQPLDLLITDKEVLRGSKE